MKKHSDSTHTTVHYKEHRTRNIILSVFISLVMTFSSLIGLVPEIALADGEDNPPPQNNLAPYFCLEGDKDRGYSFSKVDGTIYLVKSGDNVAKVVCTVDGVNISNIEANGELRGELDALDDHISVSITPCDGYADKWFTIGNPGGRQLTDNPRVVCHGNTFIYDFTMEQLGEDELEGDYFFCLIMDNQVYTFKGNFLDDLTKTHIMLAGTLVNDLCDSDTSNGYVEYTTDGGNSWTPVTDRVITLDTQDVYVRFNYDYDTQLAMCNTEPIPFMDDEELNAIGWSGDHIMMLWLEPIPTSITMMLTTPNDNGVIPEGINVSYDVGGVTGSLAHDKSPSVVEGNQTATVTLTIPSGGEYYVFVRATMGGAMNDYEPELRYGDYYFPNRTEFTINLLNYGKYEFEVWRADQFSVDWSYDTTRAEDQQIIGGRVEFYSAVLPDGSDGYRGAQGDPYQDVVSHRIMPGSLVTISLTPDHGYQFVEGYLLGYIPVTPSEDLGTFTFEMPASPVHLSSLFIEFNDEIISNVEGIDGGILLSGQNATDIGNVRLSVTNADISSSEQAAINSAAGDMYILNMVDLSLESFVKKGSWTDEWTNSITETEGDLMIVLNVGTGLDPDATYEVIREHNGVLTTIPAEFDPNTGLLTFSSNQFSTYAIVSSSPRPASGGGGGGASASGGSVINEMTVDGFIGRLYVNMLGRSGDSSGMDYWKNKIYTEGMTGADLVSGFIGSQEFTNLGLNDTEFVKVLYRTLFGREGDADGINTWVTMLSAGATRQEIVNNFINSTEWANLCLRYGIPSGGTGVPNITVTPKVGTNNFVNRLYTLCLGRNADAAGFSYWTNSLANMRISGTDCAFGFIFSDEMNNANLDDEAFIKLLYSVLLGRDASDTEISNWLAELSSGKTREEIFYGFAGSPEFGRICAENGIVR